MWIKTIDLADGPIEDKLMSGAFGELADINPANDDERFARAAARVLLRRYDEARADLQALREIPRLKTAAALEIAACELRSGTDAAVLALVDPIIEQGAGEESAQPRALHLRGVVALRRGEVQDAMRDLLAAADGYARRHVTAGSAQVNDSLGQAYLSVGQLDHALGAYARSLADKAVLGDREGIAITLGGLGRLSLQAGRYADALAYFTDDLMIARQLGDLYGEAKLLNDVGRVLSAQGKGAEAIAKQDEALALARARNLKMIQFFALKDKADTLAMMGDAPGAMAAIAEARPLLPERGGEIAALQLDLVEAEAVRGTLPDRALELVEKALYELTYRDFPDMEVQARLLAAELYNQAGRNGDAASALLLAVKRCRARGLTRYLRTLNEAMARYGVEEGVQEETGRPIGGDRQDDALSGYFLIKELGAGAFGTVYKAFDMQHGRHVALKRLALDGVFEADKRDVFLDSLRLELEAAARAKHPLIAEVYAIGRDAMANPYIVQQLVEGRQLRVMIHERTVTKLDRIAQYMAQICHAVHALHRGGVIHRDIKPENVVVRDDGNPVVIDFGIAHVAGMMKDFKGGAGTPGYAPPEQATVKSAEPKLDIYPLGIMAWEWFTGERPAKGRESIPDPAPKKRGWFGGGDKTERAPSEVAFLELVRAMLAPAEERLDSAADVAARFERIAAIAEAEKKPA